MHDLTTTEGRKAYIEACERQLCEDRARERIRIREFQAQADEILRRADAALAVFRINHDAIRRAMQRDALADTYTLIA